MAILKIRDENGKVYEVLALRGEKGDRGVDAYAKVVEYGYEGDEEEFYLAMSRNGQAPDKTLTISGACADAKATGDAIAAFDLAPLELRIQEVSASVQDLQSIANIALNIAQSAQAEAVSKAATETYIVTVTPSWIADGRYYIQDIDVPGMLATDNPIPGVAYGEDDYANELYDECFDKVSRIITSDGSIRVRAKEAISTAFPIQLKVVR